MERIALVLLAAALLSGCETSATVSAGPTPVKCVVSLAAPPMIDAAGGAGSLQISTQNECAWDVSTNVNWISALSPASGQGTADVSFRVAANDGSVSRQGTISVNGEQARVSQRAPCRYEVTPASQSVGSSGGATSIAIATTTDCAWTAITEVGWISLTSSPEGAGNGRVSFAVTSNDGGQRTGSISVGNQRALVTQAADAPPAPPPAACSVTIAPTSQNIGAAGGAGGPVNVSAAGTCRWTATSNASWITVTSGSTGTGNRSVTFSVAANSGAARNGTITIGGQSFTVTQAASSSPSPPAPPPASCTYSISPNSQQVSRNSGTSTINVSTSSGCAWTASSNTSWITVTSGASGTGNGTVRFSFTQNNGTGRTGSLTVAGRTATVEQRVDDDDDDDDDDD